MIITTFAHEICRQLEWNIQLKIKAEPIEKLHASFRKNVLTLQASDPWVEAFAIQTYPFALKANRLGDFLGTSTPRFPLRALWVTQKLEEDPEMMLQWIIGCGYNCVLCDSMPQELLRAYHMISFDLVMPQISSSDPKVTYKESLLESMKMHEGQNDQRIFYVEQGNAEWLPSLLDDMESGTWLGVDAQHLFWARLRELPDGSATPVAAVKSSKYYLQATNPLCGRQMVKGVVVKADAWPKENSKESRELWIAGQSLWWSIAPESLAETWDGVFLTG